MPENQFTPLVRRLKSVANLLERSQSILTALPHRVVNYDAGHELYKAGSIDPPCFILLEGCATRFKLRSDGSRAIVAFELTGDIINPEGLLLGRADCGARVSTPCTIAIVEKEAVQRAWEADRDLESTLWRYALVKAAALEEWLLNVGRRSPTGRLAHLFLELHLRLVAVETPTGDTLKLHVSPNELADAMGLLPVIVTRCLHDLASQNAIVLSGDAIVLCDLGLLTKIGDFRSEYLHFAA